MVEEKVMDEYEEHEVQIKIVLDRLTAEKMARERGLPCPSCAPMPVLSVITGLTLH